MPTTKQISQQRLNRLESIPDKLITAVDQSQKEILRTIIRRLDALEVKNGIIILSAENQAVMQGIINDLGRITFGTNYNRAVLDFIGEFDQQATINQSYFAEVEGSFTDKAIYRGTLRQSKLDAATLLSEASIKTELQKDLATTLRSAVNSQRFTDLVDTLTKEILGSPERLGSLQNYISGIARDLFSFADASYIDKIASDLSFEFFFYSGKALKASRPFCLVRKGKYYHRLEVESWTTGQTSEGNPAPNKVWAGMFKNTNPRNIFVFRGGHSCVDILIPAAISQVPEDVIERNIESGNIKRSQLAGIV